MMLFFSFEFIMHYSSSETFLWSSNDSLGKGATGGVYKGRHLKTGKLVAVKVFNNETSSFWRELDILKNTPPHDNIVRFLSMESEHSTKRRVIIMELCTGGSLYNVIDHPENGYGLEESELLIVLRDVVAGLNHLHQNKIIHRDIKPGNIMRCINQDGSYNYKLVDFGAARQLDPSDTFTSLYGTEEYLHPDMYERAVLRKNKGKTFSRIIDLWSIGATFYHVITGKLPFRPFLGRQDQQVMFKMTGDKNKGVICAYQLETNGQIFWETTLPIYIRTLPHLRLLLTGILAGILESNPDNCMSFFEFVEQIFLITSLRVITIFMIFDGSFLRIFVEFGKDSSDWFFQLKEKVYSLTKIPTSDQIYFFNNRYFQYALGEEFPQSNESNPFYLVNLTNEFKDGLFQFPPELIYPENTMSLEKDYYSTKSALSYLYFYKRKCKFANDSSHLIDKISSLIFSTINSEYSKFESVKVLVGQIYSKQFAFNNICKYIIKSLSIDSETSKPSFHNILLEIRTRQDEIDSLAKDIEENLEKFISKFSDKIKICSPFPVISSFSFYSVSEMQFELHIKKLTEAQNCFAKDFKHNTLVHPLEKANHTFTKQDASYTLSEAKVLIENVRKFHSDHHIQFINWFQRNIEPNLIVLTDIRSRIEEIEISCNILSDLVEKSQNSIFQRSFNIIPSQNFKLMSADLINYSADFNCWNEFVQLAGPSFLCIESLTNSLPDIHNN